MNLPTKISVNGDGNGEISYIYDATGVKLEKKVTEGNSSKTTQYAGGHIYENGSLKYFDQPGGYVEPKNAGDYGLGFDYTFQYRDHLGNIRLAYRDDPLRSTRFQQEFEGTTGDWHTQANEVSVSNGGGRLDISLRRMYFSTWAIMDVMAGEPVEIAFDFDKGDMEQVHVSIGEFKDGAWEPWNERDFFYSVQTGRFETGMTPVSDKIRIIIEKGGGADNGTFTTCHIDNLSVTQTAVKVVDVKGYYPFGLQHKGYNILNSGHPYGFNGKELTQELGLNTYDFGARNYNPSLGRWMNVDPLANKYYHLSGYNYTANNPILFVDPDGKYIDISGLSKKHQASFGKFLGTKEGERFLLLYGSAGQDVLGHKVEKNGKYSKHTIYYFTENTYRDSKEGGKTTMSIRRKNANNFISVASGSVREDNLSEALGFRVSIGTDESVDKATVTIGHESFVHVEKNTKDFENLVSDYKDGTLKEKAVKTGTSEGFLLVQGIININGKDKSDHKLFVDGKVSSYENFIKELGSLYKNISDEDKKRAK